MKELMALLDRYIEAKFKAMQIEASYDGNIVCRSDVDRAKHYAAEAADRVVQKMELYKGSKP